MRETSFIKQNKDKWKEFEQLSSQTNKDPDELSRYFVEITDDLSYARTFYPNRSVRIYLNGIARKAFQSIYKNKQHNIWKRFVKYWRHDLPLALYESRIELYVATLIFLISVAIGVISTHYDPDFAKYILTEDYIKMTEENIAKGDPMGVYKNQNAFEMFFSIATNNLRIDFMMFVLGGLFAVGTVIFVMYNGIMLGTFQFYFYQKGLLVPTALTIWLHGTLEMSMMVIVAAAGMTMGRGLLFPGSYKRLHAFQISALRGIKIFIAVLPFTFIAAVIESWVTRHTEAPSWMKVLLILGSFLFVVGYFYLLPLYKKYLGHFEEKEPDFVLPPDNQRTPLIKKYNSNDEIFRDMFWCIRHQARLILRGSAIIAVLFAFFCLLFYKEELIQYNSSNVVLYIFDLINFENSTSIFWPLTVVFTGIFSLAFISINQLVAPGMLNLYSYIRVLLSSLFLSILLFFTFYESFGFGCFFFLFLFPMALQWYLGLAGFSSQPLKAQREAFNYVFTDFWKFTGMNIVVIMIGCFIYLLFSSPVYFLLDMVIHFNLPLEQESLNIIVLGILIFLSTFILCVTMHIWVYAAAFLYHSLKELATADYLQERIAQMAVRNQHKKTI